MAKEYKQNISYEDILKDSSRSEATQKVNTQNKYSLPYGLCAKYGISLPNGATPTDAWNALKGIGIKPSEVYKDVQTDGKVNEVQPTGKKVKESKSENQKAITNQEIDTEVEKTEVVDGESGNTAFEDAYSQERKNKALWFKGVDSLKESQKVYTTVAGKVWGAATYAQKKAAYEYTEGSGGFNRPLRGYQDIWGKYGYKGVGNVALNHEGKGNQIKELTSMIDKSYYNEDIWLQHGSSFDAAKQFLGITGNITAEKVKSLIGKEVIDYGFFSCGASKGTGFSGLDCTFNVYCPAGTKMLYCAPFSKYSGAGMKWDGKTALGGYENEMLIQRQSTYRITKAECQSGKWYFDIEITKQEINDDIYKK